MNKYSIAIVLTCLFCVSQAQTTFTVTNTDDSGVGSLRQAILDAEANPGEDIIDMTGVSGTITLSTGLPNITEDLTINGAGSASTIIDGNDLVRPFFIGGAGVNDTDAPVVQINDLTIQNGLALGETPQLGNGGGAGMGGAIFINDGDVRISNVTFDGNNATGGTGGNGGTTGIGTGGNGPFPGLGGNPSTTTSNFFNIISFATNGGYGAGGGAGNASFNDGGSNGANGGYGAGGGGAGGTFTAGAHGSRGLGGTFGGHGGVTLSAASAGGGGGAGLGGAIFLRNGLLVISNSTVSNNGSTGGSGGSASFSGEVGGDAQGKGGAIFNQSGTAYTENVTFTSNTASNEGATASDNGNNYGQMEELVTTAINTQPLDQLAQDEGNEVNFTVAAVGTALTYQWQVDDGNGFVDLSNDATYSGVNTATLNISCVTTVLDGLAYQVVVTGFVNGVTSSTANLGVSALPLLVDITGTSETSCSQGEELTFTANPSNVLETAAYRWFVDGVEVSGETNSTLTRTSFADEVITVELSDPSACFARIPVISDDFTIMMVDSPDPEVAITLNIAEICETTELASFTATPTLGGDNPTYSWTVDGEHWGGGATRDVGGFQDGSIVQVVMTSNEECLTGPATATATYVVQFGDGPPITQQPQDVTAEILGAASATFTVAATGAGLNYQWQYNRAGGVFEDFADGDVRSGELTAAGSNTPTLTLTNISDNNWHNTQVRCVITEGTCGTFSDGATLFFTGGTIVVQNTNATGAGSFHEAVQTANNLAFSSEGVPVGPTTIDLRQVSGTIELESGLFLEGGVTMIGPGPSNLTIGWASAASFAGALIQITSSRSDVTMDIGGLTFDGTNNAVSASTGLSFRPQGSNDYTLQNCVFTNFLGYQTFLNGTLSIDGAQFSDYGVAGVNLSGASQIINSTFTNAGQDGINISGATEISIDNVTVTNATQDGVEINADAIGITNSSFAGNGAEGLYINSAGGTGQYQIQNVHSFNNAKSGMRVSFWNVATDITISEVSSYGNQHGITFHEEAYANATISRSTFSDNSDFGVYVESGGFQMVNLTNVTLTNNQYGVFLDGGTLELNNSIVLGNTQRNLFGTVSSTLGYNVYKTRFGNGVEEITGITTGNVLDIATSSVLDAAQTVSGERFYPLLACTPVINAGAPTGASATDQIGNALVGTSDPGAVEFQSAQVPLAVSVAINQITVNPCPGDLIEMEAVPTNGGENPAYRWLKDGVQLSTNSSIVVSVGTQDNYQLEMTTSEDCLVDQKVVTVDFVPNFQASAEITQQPEVNNVINGQDATFSVTATGTSLTYQWQLSDNGGTSFTDLTDGGQVSGATTPTLTISSVSLAEAGNLYRVVITEAGGCVITSDEVQLNLALTLVVTSLLDNEIVDSDITLREALNTVISEAGNSNFSEANPIVVDASGLSGTIELATALPAVTWHMKLVGPSDQSLTIRRSNAAANFGIFTLQGSAFYRLENLVIENGNASRGGGIYALGSGNMEIENCLIQSNFATLWGGGISFERSSGIMTVNNSTIKFNSSNNSGGGIMVRGNQTAIVKNSLINNNSSVFFGGGLVSMNVSPVHLISTTFSENTITSTSGRGGPGVILDKRASNKVISSTFTLNSAASPALDFNDNSGGSAVTQLIEGNIVAGNTGNSHGRQYNVNMARDGFLTGSGNVFSSDEPLDEFGTDNLYGIPVSDLIVTVLADNGGSILTYAMLDCSPAIDIIAASNTNVPATDATGASRTGNADAGAVEFVGTPTVFTDHPEDLTINKDEQAVFMAAATSGSAINFQWQVDTGSGFADLTDDANYSGATTATLTIDDVPESFDGNRYRLNISGSCDNSSEEVTLTVENPAPVFNSTPITEAAEGVPYFYSGQAQDPQGDPLAFGNNKPNWITSRIDRVSGPHFSISGAVAPLSFVETAAPDNGSNLIYSISGSIISSVTITGQEPSQVDFSSLNPISDFPNKPRIAVKAADELYFAYIYDNTNDPLYRIVKTDPTAVSPVFTTVKDVGLVEDLRVNPAGGLVILERSGSTYEISLVSDAGVVTSIKSGLSGVVAMDVTPGGKIFYLTEIFGMPTSVDLVELALDGSTSSIDVLGTEDVYVSVDLVADDFGNALIHWQELDASANIFERITHVSAQGPESLKYSATQDINSITISGYTRFGDNDAFFIENTSTTSSFLLYAENAVLIGTPSLSDISVNNFVSISANDDINITRQEFTINIAFDNDPPTGINISANSIDENNATNTSLLTFTTVDPNIAFDQFTYELTAGAGDTDNAEFAIVDDGLKATVVYDAESNPGDKSIRVRSTDLGGESVEETFTISINDINDAPTAIALSGNMEVEENLDAGTVIGTLTSTDQDAGDTHTYSLSGIGSDLFQVIGDELQTAASLDFEQAASYTLTVTTTDAGQLTYDEDFTITIINDAPTDITLSNSSVDEGLLPGAIVGTFSTTDTDPSNSFTYSFVTGSNFNALFEIDGDVLKTKGLFDATQFSSALIRVKTTDAIGESFEKDLTITINDLTNSPPQLFNAPAANATQGTLYTFVPGIYDFNGDVVTITETAPSWLQRQDQPAVIETIVAENRATDMTIDEDDNLYIIINDANGSPTNIQKYDDDTETTSLLLTTLATSISFVDVDENGVVYFADNNFQGNSWKVQKIVNGTVSTVYNATGDVTAGGYHEDEYLVLVETQSDNTKDIIRIDLDGMNKTTLEEEVGFVGVFDIGEDDNIHYATGATMTAIDIDGDPATAVTLQLTTDNTQSPYLYFISDFVKYSSDESYVMYVEADASGTQTYVLVRVTSTGEEELWRSTTSSEANKIASNSSFDVFFTRDADSNMNFGVDRYQRAFTFYQGTPEDSDVGTSTFDLSLSDGTASNDYSFTIAVANVNDAPTSISLSSTSVDENNDTGVSLLTISAEDPDNDEGDTHTFSLVTGEGDTDNGSFEISGTDLKATAAFDHESDATKTIRVKATDASNAIFEQTLEINISDLNESPTAIELSSASINENEATGTTIGTLTTIDPDATNDNLVFEIIEGEENFQLSGSELQSAESFDFESDATLTVKIKASDGEENSDTFFTIEETFTINVGDVSESPSDLALSNHTVAENSETGTVVGTLTAQDPDGTSTATFTLTEGVVDNASFDITDDQLITATIFNFESDASYTVEVQVADGNGNTFTEQFAISITDDNDAPIFTTSGELSVAENTTEVTTLAATDEDTDAELTFSIVDGTDQDLFELSGATLSFVDAPDFEAPDDEDADNAYEVTVSVSDGTHETDLAITVTVTNANDAPTLNTSNMLTIVENTTTPFTLVATDADSDTELSFSLVGGADQESFSSAGAEVSFVNAPDFENPGDANGDNTYEFTLRVSDGTNEVDTEMTVMVTNENEAPTGLTISATSVDENAEVGTVIGTLASTDQDGTFTHSYSLAESETNFKIADNQLQTKAILDFETQASYDITITVTDEGSLSFEQEVTITVNDLDETKANSSIEIAAIEDMEAGSAAFELSAVTNPENAEIIWSIVEGDATIDGTTLTPGTQSGLVVVKAVIEETNEFNGSEDTESFSLLDPTLIDPIVTVTLPEEAAIIETVTVGVTLDAQGATTISESDIILGIESGPGVLSGNQLTFTGDGTVVVSATLNATSSTNAVYTSAEMEVFQVYNISGRALADGEGYANGLAYLVASDNFNETLNVLLSSDGSFTLENVKEGDYYLGIGVPQTETTYLTTFYGDKSPILDPTAVPDILKLSSDMSGLVVNMQAKPAPAVDLVDPTTGGKIEFQAQGAPDGQNRIILGRVEMGDPIPNTQVVLSTADGEYVADGLTDEQGFITFEGLPTGDYRIGVEIPGVGRVETEIPVEEGEQADVTGLISEDGTVALEIEEVLNVDLEKEALTIYPNPVMDQLNLILENDYRGELTFRVFDLNGKTVLGFSDHKRTRKFQVNELLEIPSGTYIMLITGNDLSLQQRFIKR